LNKFIHLEILEDKKELGRHNRPCEKKGKASQTARSKKNQYNWKWLLGR